MSKAFCKATGFDVKRSSLGGRLPIPDEALQADIAILGKKGRNKSYLAKLLVERLLDLGERVLVLDPLGHWWELKSSANGEAPGYPIAVFGGQHADIEITETAGRGLARLLCEETVSAIIDMGTMRKTEQQRLIADMLDELFTLNREPLTIVLEEADAFAPQSPMGPLRSRPHCTPRAGFWLSAVVHYAAARQAQ
jgi:uncharacterized protein